MSKKAFCFFVSENHSHFAQTRYCIILRSKVYILEFHTRFTAVNIIKFT